MLEVLRVSGLLRAHSPVIRSFPAFVDGLVLHPAIPQALCITEDGLSLARS